MFKDQVTDVFFDLDHTLWDFEKNSALTFQKIFEHYNIQIFLDDFLEVYVPANLAFWKLYREEKITKSALRYQRLKTVFDALKYEVSDKTINDLSHAYIEHLSTYNHLFPETKSVLEYLRPTYNLHIITNGFQEVQEKKLKNAGIHHFFTHIVDSEMAGVKKPNPIIFELALRKASAVPSKSLMIGDSIEADILGAKSLGFNTLHFNAHNDPRHDHCHMITTLGEIKSYL